MSDEPITVDTLKALKAEAYDLGEQIYLAQQKLIEINQKIAEARKALGQN